MTRIIGNDLARFESMFEREPMSGCWLWVAADDGRGYGKFWLSGEIVKAHRASWRLYRGGIPRGQWVLHRCDNPACVNPTHLFLGDRSANMRDMARKGRQVFQVDPSKVRRGERGPGAKISEADARSIVDRLVNGESGAALARQFGISRCTVSAIKVGRIWKHLRANPRAEVEIEPMQPQQAELAIPEREREPEFF